MNTILFVGSNPSTSSLCNAAFHGSTRSSKILTEWTKDVKGTKLHVNVSSKKTEKNRPLTVQETKDNLDGLEADIIICNPDKIVALGKTAAKALDLLKLDHFKMFHPSGRNRVLNDKALVEKKISEMVAYCSSVDCPLPIEVVD